MLHYKNYLNCFVVTENYSNNQFYLGETYATSIFVNLRLAAIGNKKLILQT